MNTLKNEDERKIDDPGLNQDSTYDKKDDEDFDDSDDFHKHDDTDTEKKPINEEKVKEPPKSVTNDTVKNAGMNDGNIYI